MAVEGTIKAILQGISRHLKRSSMKKELHLRNSKRLPLKLSKF